jgi:hypothetical protein
MCYNAIAPSIDVERMKPPTTLIQFAQHVETLAFLVALAQCVSL